MENKNIDVESNNVMEAISDIGVSRKRNEDSILYMEIELILKGGRATRLVLMLVCDGMGGLNAGNWASSYCCNSIERIVESRQYRTINELISKIETGIYTINNDIVKENRSVSEETGEKVRAGTTMTLLMLHDGIGHLRHLGDSRLYEILPSKSESFHEEIEQNVQVISEDQSEVMREVRRGNMTYEEAMKSKRMNVLYMCLGIFPSNKLEIFKVDFQLHPDASYLISTDGFWHGMSDQDLIKLADREYSIKDLIQRKKELDGEKDNISALIYRSLRVK